MVVVERFLCQGYHEAARKKKMKHTVRTYPWFCRLGCHLPEISTCGVIVTWTKCHFFGDL